MRRKIINRLYVGTVEDCKAVGADFSIVHACKHPCHAEKCGATVAQDSQDYLAKRDGRNLYLNIIDPKEPLFRKEVFMRFLEFAQAEHAAQRTILIHCNKGESRSPSLALLFLAKCLHQLPNDSYDAAWDAFEKLLGEPYTPSQGIETWLRRNWHEIPLFDTKPSGEAVQVASKRVTGKREELPPLEMPQDAASCLEVVRSQPLFHFAGFMEIEDKDHKWVTPTPNALQFDVAEAYNWCLDNGVAPRLIILKPRQVGCSTISCQLCYHHMRRFPSDMLIMGDVSKRTEKMFAMFNDFVAHDKFEWDSRYNANTEKGTFRYANGSEGLVEHDTALDPKAGISGTRQVLWMTEAARYLKINGRDKKVITAVLQSLANTAKSLGIMESTAEGAVGVFYETWKGAASLEDRKNGVVGNGWIKVFAPWFVFVEHALERKPENASYFGEELDDRERRGIALYQWTPEQIAWRRMKIRKDCANDTRMFDQDFPEDAESCFLASGRARFNAESLTQLEKQARLRSKLARVGCLEESSGNVVFHERTDGEAWVWVDELPTYGCRYIGFIDPCTGEQSQGSEFPDSHAAGILRAGYHDEKGRWNPPRLVACVDVHNGCRWDDELIAERLVRLSNWYGGCMIVPETGNGLGVLNELRRAGAVLYQREKLDAMHPGQKLKVIGWETNGDTRPLVVNAIANYIREVAFELNYLPAIEECKTFIVNSRGKAEAKSGCHDDWVMGIGIGLYNLELARTYLPPQIQFYRNEPSDSNDAISAGALS